MGLCARFKIRLHFKMTHFYQPYLQNYTKVPTEAILRRKMHCSELIYCLPSFLRVFVVKKIFRKFFNNYYN